MATKVLKKITQEENYLLATKSVNFTDEDLEMFYLNARDNVILPFENRIREIHAELPGFFYNELLPSWQKIIKKATGPDDIINWAYSKLEYYHAIKTQKELEYQFQRCKDIVYFNGLELPIVLIFDYQFVSEDSFISRNPTFYSTFKGDVNTSWGRGAYYIAFPATAAYLTDEELMVAMKHEFGHIVQGHCSIHSGDAFDVQYMNQSMDISINLGMTEQEQNLLIKVAEKLFGTGTYPCMSLIAPHGQGGFGIPQLVQSGDWQTPHDFIRLYYKNKDKKGQQGKGSPQQGQGGGSGESGEGEGQQIDDKINVGDFVILRGSDPKVYGRVSAIDDTTGKAVYDEISQEEWEEMKKNM